MLKVVKACVPWLNGKIAAVAALVVVGLLLCTKLPALSILAGTTPLSPAQRTAHQELIGRLFGSLLQETRELPDGYAYRFDGEHYPLVAEFITNERFCCPFLTFSLNVSPHRRTSTLL